MANNNIPLYPGVKRVEYVLQKENIDIEYIGNPNLYPVSIQGNFQEICLVKLGSLTTDIDDKGNQAIAKAKLSFFSKTDPLKIGAKYLFRITLLSGEQYLLGWQGISAPTIKVKHIIPDKVTSRRGFDYTIEWECYLSPIRLK